MFVTKSHGRGGWEGDAAKQAAVGCFSCQITAGAGLQSASSLDIVSCDILLNDYLEVQKGLHAPGLTRSEPCVSCIAVVRASRGMEGQVASDQALRESGGRSESDQRSPSGSVGVVGAAHGGLGLAKDGE